MSDLGLYRFTLLVSCALVFLSAAGTWGQLDTGPWPMFRHDLRRSALSPNHDAPPGGPYWTSNTGFALASPAIASDGTTYAVGGYYLRALNSDGTIRWSFLIGDSVRSSPAIASDGTIYIGCNEKKLYAINPDGTQKWVFVPGSYITSSPAIGPDGTIYVGCKDGKLYAVNPDGTQKWQCSTGGEIHMSSPAVGPDGTIYVGSCDARLYAINPDGTVKWSYLTGDDIISSPSVSPDGATVYAASWDGYLYAISSVGALRWVFLVAFVRGSTSSSPGVAADGTVYIGSNYGQFYAVSPAGTELWHIETNSDIRSSPAISADGTIYVACYDGYLYALNSDGTRKWVYVASGGFFASPAIAADGSVVAVGGGNTVGNLTTTPPTANPPTNLVVTAISDTQSRLTWQDNSSDEYGFHIERRVGDTGTFSLLATVGAGVTTCTDSNLGSGQTYYYRVTAYQMGGDSAYSNVASVTMPGIIAPSNLAATPVSGTRTDLTWTDGAPDELYFIIERMTGPNGHFQRIGRVGANVTSYSDLSVNPATNYYYRVRALDTTRSSDYSNQRWALTPGKDLSGVSTGNTARKQMALTFDAGTANIRPTLLTILRNRGLHCSFFITGRVAETQPSLLQTIARDGHHIGNHTYNHPDLRTCTDTDIVDQLELTDNIIYGITGHRTRSYFRAPYGYTDDRVLAVAANAGFQHVYWTTDSGDASWNAGTQEIIDRTMASASNGCIMLYHCTLANTEAALPTIIDNLWAQGYELVTIPELTAPKVITSPPGALNAGWNLMSLPIEPAIYTPTVVFRGLSVSSQLFRWDKETGSLVSYDSWDPDAFGQTSADEGYWLYMDMPAAIKFAGSEVTNDRHIKLPQGYSEPSGAWTCIGYPFETTQEWGNCSVYNPNVSEPRTRDLAEACSAGWMRSLAWWWDSSTQSLMDLDLAEFWPSSTQIEPWRGYWVQSDVPELDLVIPRP